MKWLTKRPNPDEEENSGKKKKCLELSPRGTSNSDATLSDACNTSNIKERSTSALFPQCWPEDQHIYFRTEYKWLVVQNKLLGCNICRKINQVG